MTHHDLKKADGRILALAEQFDIDPPELTYDEDGELLVKDEWIDWCRDAGASIDWIICGDPKSMTSVFRREMMKDREVLDAIKGLDTTELAILTEALSAIADDGADPETALATAKTRIDAYRQREPEAAA